ncbi:uncharacterized protein [Trachinotus anak]|uniref:uncharacterized protein n=1 Tax=Trachinotus anak TaxID=443729 RepID=UPI0039F1DF92
MTPLKFAWYLTCLFLGSSAQTPTLKSPRYVRQDSGFIAANVGENVTLQCVYEGNGVMFYWYKQPLGQKPRAISTFYKHDEGGTFHNEFEDNPRFSLEAGNGKYHLTISDLRISDSATYYCVGCYAYDFEFVDGVTVSVKGSGLNIQALVHQSGSEPIQSTDQLSCTVHPGTCDGEHSVYWFRNSGEFQPGLIYTNGDRDDQCERKPDTQTHNCVYNLPVTSRSLSHDELTYCAVASCGHILFGNKKKPDSEDGDNSLALVYFLSGALAFTTILAVLLSYAAYKMNNSSQHTDFQARTSPDSNANGYQNSDNLHYAALRKHNTNRSKRHRENTQTECVYSTVRQ